MINKIKQVRDGIYTKATAVIGIAAIMGLAFVLGCQQTSNNPR
jgi:hypothetical protein